MTSGPSLIRAGLVVVLVAVFVSTVLGFTGSSGARNVGNGVLLIGFVVGLPLLAVGAVLKTVRRKRT